ncbi:SdrD B-like domain-containing protein [Dyadobacter sp. CY312]|uniref:SdrD B-like domain-containing protein n=1 Tax=Dyadobacter sp. CY312 TaxID=2907303 RepID=UPI001F3EE4D5|nr:SdrD B-like domain-containing protein [Dyadobacter sp. CY312]MCE7044645.1 T9SS type A sorting domain-containing protein [Dyadobacter sp. CY312]
MPHFTNSGLNYYLKHYMFLLGLFLLVHSTYAQCPADISVTTPPDVVGASCPSSGQVTIHSDVETLSTATYQIISATEIGSSTPLEGYQTTSQSSNVFTSLPAGDYTVRISCGTVFEDVTFTISDLYTPLTLTPTVSNVCAGGGMGGTITAAAMGGKAPLIYGFLQSTNAAEPDANFSYQASNVFTAPGFGIYQVRVKDACNNFTTASVDVQPSSPKAKFHLQYESFTCATTTYTGNRLLRLGDATQIDPDGSGYVVDMWNILSTEPCTVPAGAPDMHITVNSNADISSITFPSTAEKVLIRTTSPCGEVNIECVDIKHPDILSYGTVHVGCPDGSEVNLALNTYNGVTFSSAAGNYYELDVQGYDASNNPVTGTTLTDYQWVTGAMVPVPYADHYTYTITDACGDTETKTIVTPKPSNAGFVNYVGYSLACVTTVGTLDLDIQIAGYVPDQDFSTIKLLRASDHSFVANATGYNAANGAVSFKAIPPGSYIIQFTPTDATCGVITEVPFTTDPAQTGLTLGLTGTTSQLCGGNGTITSALTYNGNRPVSFELLQGSTVVATNSSGSFPNLAAGTYTLRATMDMSNCGVPNLVIDSQNLTITPSGSDPVVVRKLGINCEGTVATGKAIFQFAGSGPFILEMKKTTETNYTLINAAVPNDYTADGLEASTDYDVRITDQCGETEVTQVSIKPLVVVLVTNSAQPCLNQPYTLSVDEITGATYSWTFNGTAMPGVTGKDIVFGSYTAANNGTYQATIKLGDCITRITTVNLNSINCSQPLNKSGLGDYVWQDSNMNGIQDAGEAGQSGVTVTLYGPDGTTVIAVTTTDANGYYNFSNLEAGSYVVGFSNLPSGYGFTSQTGSLNDANNSDANTSGKTAVIILADNEFNLNVDAGIYNTLPVKLISLTAKKVEEAVQLNWSTSAETNSDHFEIQYSTDAKSWTAIGVVESNKESATVKKYSFVDTRSISGQHFYRLRMVDSDLSFAYSRIVSVQADSEGKASVYPNPVSDVLYLKDVTLASVADVAIFNAAGQMVLHLKSITSEGISLAKLVSGVYTVKVKELNGFVQTMKVVVVK